ncbi:MAG: glycosyltransferase family 1 protein [Crocinitomicaceae bacterium]|nr:glycosyltransferase family 1 protein [Crocinitomicaceae bacterium]
MDDEFETLLIGGLPEEGETDSLHILEEYGVKPLIIKELKRIPSIKSDREAYEKIKTIIQEFKPDIVHTHAAKAGALGRRAAFACKVPIVIHTFHGHVFHSYFNPIKTHLYKFIEKKLAKKSTAIIAISPIQSYELSRIHKICAPDKIKVIPLGFDLQKFQKNYSTNRLETRNKYQLNQNQVAIAITGRLTKIKNHFFFLNVVEKLLEQGETNARFFIVGDGELKNEISDRVKEINQKYGVYIELTSWILDISEFNAGMDIACLTSDNEGTPVSLIEAQASNLPVISTDVGGVKDILKEGSTGYVIEKGDLEEYVEKLGILIKNKELRTKFASNGWPFVKERFDYSRLVNDMKLFYNELIARKNV